MKNKIKIIVALFIAFSFLSVKNIKAVEVTDIVLLNYNDIIKIDNDEELNNGRIDDPFPDGFKSPKKDDNFTCQTILIKANGESTEFKKILDGFFGIMQFLAPSIAIVLTVIDYMKSLTNGDTKKANKRTVIRIAIAVLIVFLPSLLDLLFHLFGLYDISSCGIGR